MGGAQEEDRPADGHGAVDLAGVNDADHVIAQRDDDPPRRANSGGRPAAVGQADDIGDGVVAGEGFDFLLPQSAADEEEFEGRVVFEFSRGFQQRPQRDSPAVVAGTMMTN
jgi:hypothetical protein